MDRPKTKLKNLPLNLIRPSATALRQVNRKKPEYHELVGSVRDRGVLNAILVREIKDPDNPSQILYGLIEGLHRYSAAQDAGLDEIPAQIMNMSDADVLETQIIGNAQRIETKRFEFANQIARILNQNPTMTRSEIGARLSKTEAWVSQTLKLTDLPPNVGKLVDDNKIVLANAYALVDLHRVAPDEVENFLDRAQTLSPTEFAPKINQRVGEIRKDKRAGKDPRKNEEFVPVPIAQKSSVLKAEYERPDIGPKLIKLTGATTAEEGFRTAMMWVMHMDPISIEEGRKKFEIEKERSRLDKERRAQERAAKREAEAREVTDEALA